MKELHVLILAALFFVCNCFEQIHGIFTPGSFGDSGLYKVAIDKTRVPLLDETVGENENKLSPELPTVVMHNRKGVPFRCTIPEVQKTADDRDKLIDLTTEKVEAALTPVESNRGCIQLVTSGWWHYEFCFNKHVQQYHLENNVIVKPVISLGVYSHSFNWSGVSAKVDLPIPMLGYRISASLVFQDALHRTDRFHTQVFVNGTECDINGAKRQTNVKFYCDNGNWATDYIESVKEPESCVYEVIVHSKRLCAISYFKKDEPIVGNIVCNPIGVPKPKRQEGPDALLDAAETPASAAELRQNFMESLMREEPGSDTNYVEEAETEAGDRFPDDNVNRITAEDDEHIWDLHKGMEESKNVITEMEKLVEKDEDQNKREMDDAMLEALIQHRKDILADVQEEGITPRERAFLDKYLRTVDIMHGLKTPGQKRTNVFRAATDNIGEAIKLLTDDMFWPNLRDVLQNKNAELQTVTQELEAADLKTEIIKKKLDQSNEAATAKTNQKKQVFVDWASFEPLTEKEREVKDSLIITEVALKYARNNQMDVKYSTLESIHKKAYEEMDKIMKSIVMDQRTEIRAEFAGIVADKFDLFEELITGKMSSDASTARARKSDFFDAQTELEKQLIIEWARLRPFSPRETVVYNVLTGTTEALQYTLAGIALTDVTIVTTVIERAARQISVVSELIDSSSETEVREKFSRVVEKKIQQMRDLIQRIRADLGQSTEQELVSTTSGLKDGDSEQAMTRDEAKQVAKQVQDLAASTQKPVRPYQGDENDFELISSDENLSDDEKIVLHLLSQSFQESKIIDQFSSSWSEETKKKRSILALDLMNQAEAVLADPTRNVGERYRTEVRAKVKTMREMLIQSNAMEQSIVKLRAAREELTKGHLSYEEWNKKFGRTLSEAKEAKEKAARMRQQREAEKLGLKSNRLPLVKQPSSKAVTFQDLIAEMDPSYRKMKEIENMIRERFSTTFGNNFPVEVKLIEPGQGRRAIDAIGLPELELIRKNLAGAFANQLHAVFEQQRGVDELESNYNLDDEEEDYTTFTDNFLDRFVPRGV